MSFRRYLMVLALALSVTVLCSLPLSAAERESASVAHIKLSGTLDEAPIPLDPFFGTSRENFKSKLDRIKKAKDDDTIQGLYLYIDEVSLGWGKLHELRRAIAEFRKAGKKTFAYVEQGSARDYLLAVACDEVYVPESGWVLLTGLRAEVTFYKDLLDKIGVKADMLQMGAFKGAAEPLTRSSMSPEFRKQFESVLDDYFEKDLIGLIVESRGPKKELTAEKVKMLIDEGPFTAKAALAAGLIDRVAYPDALSDHFKESLKIQKVRIVKNYARAKVEEIDFSDLFSILKLLKPTKTVSTSKPKVAVVYATGVIVTGKGGENLLDDDSVCGSTTMIEAIRQAEEDKTVKAIVLRVDSPGGSALASDLIWSELVKCKKPLVASMSDTAASGGYYISMAGAKIFAEPGTLTGSIGVVGGKYVLGGLYDKIGIKTEVISRGANSGLFSSTSEFTPSERKAIKGLMEDTYNQFLEKAIKGREKAGKKFTREELTKYAEGRVWTGRQAKEIGLVDELGTLEDAVAAAWSLAKMDKDVAPEWLILPHTKSFFDRLMDSKTDSRSPVLGIRELSLLRGIPELAGHLRSAEGLLRMRGEPVWIMMPYRVEVK